MSHSTHLQILGTGSAFGQTRLTAEDLSELTGQACELAGLKAARYSVLHREYLQRTRNSAVDAVRQEGNQTPTDLAVQAAAAALAEAKIDAEQVSLVIGDCNTPLQSTPSEGQRVADRLGLKVAAYDVSGGGISPLQLSILSRWRRDRVAEYTLLLSVSTPTARVVYQGSEHRECWSQFSDAAFACVISTKHLGKFSVVDAEAIYTGLGNSALEATVCGSKEASLVIDAYEPLRLDRQAYIAQCERLMDEHTGRAIFKNKLHGAHCFLTVGEVCEGTARRIAERHDLVNFSSTFSEYGQLLGVGGLCGLSQFESKINSGDKLIVVDSTPGIISGYSVLIANG